MTEEAFFKQRMLTGKECRDCAQVVLIGLASWLLKFRDIYKKTSLKLDPRALAIALSVDVILFLVVKILDTAFEGGCIKRRLLEHTNRDIRITIAPGHRHRIRGVPFPADPVFTPGGGSGGGAGASSDFGEPNLWHPKLDPVFQEPIEDFEGFIPTGR